MDYLVDSSSIELKEVSKEETFMVSFFFFFGGIMKDLIIHCYLEENLTVEEIADMYKVKVNYVKEILQAYWKREC